MMEDLLEFLYLMPIGIVKFDSDGAIDLMNPVATALLVPYANGGNLDNLYVAMNEIFPELRDLVARYPRAAGTIVEKRLFESRVDDHTKVVSVTINRVDRAVHMAAIEDVTKIALQDRKIFDDREKFRAIFEHVRDYAIYTVTSDGTIEEWNQSLERYAGWTPADVRERSIEMFLPPDDVDRPKVTELLAEAERIGSCETEGWRLKADGSRLWENTVITALPDARGAVRGFTVVARDMTERKRVDDAIRLLATVDPLTGAYNRRHGDALVSAELSRRQRHGDSFATLMLDVDHFKAINDRYGHPAGDAVLIELVKRVQNGLRTADTIARWGGEEFLILLPGVGASAAVIAAERLRAIIAATPVRASADLEPIRFTVSIGVAVPTSSDADELLRRCDVALYAAKEGGRDRVVLAP